MGFSYSTVMVFLFYWMGQNFSDSVCCNANHIHICILHTYLKLQLPNTVHSFLCGNCNSFRYTDPNCLTLVLPSITSSLLYTMVRVGENTKKRIHCVMSDAVDKRSCYFWSVQINAEYFFAIFKWSLFLCECVAYTYFEWLGFEFWESMIHIILLCTYLLVAQKMSITELDGIHFFFLAEE